MEGLFDQRRYLIPFRSSLLPQIFTDTLVIGAGVAGVRSALAAAGGGEVIGRCKGEVLESRRGWAEWGMAGVMGGEHGYQPKAAATRGTKVSGDDVEAHIHDTLVCGAGLCDEPVV